MSNRVNIDGTKTLTIDSENFGSIFVPSTVRGEFDETEDNWSIDVDDYSRIRNFEIGTHQIIQNHERLDDTFHEDVKISIKCLQCNFDCIVTSHEREAAIYALLNHMPCEQLSRKI